MLAYALERAQCPVRPKNTIIFGAPDVDQAQLGITAGLIASTRSQLVLLMSSRDKALKVARTVNGWRGRAGLLGNSVCSHPAILAIDCTAAAQRAPTEFWMPGHSYIVRPDAALRAYLTYLISDRGPDDTLLPQAMIQTAAPALMRCNDDPDRLQPVEIHSLR